MAICSSSIPWNSPGLEHFQFLTQKFLMRKSNFNKAQLLSDSAPSFEEQLARPRRSQDVPINPKFSDSFFVLNILEFFEIQCLASYVANNQRWIFCGVSHPYLVGILFEKSVIKIPKNPNAKIPIPKSQS